MVTAVVFPQGSATVMPGGTVTFTVDGVPQPPVTLLPFEILRRGHTPPTDGLGRLAPDHRRLQRRRDLRREPRPPANARRQPRRREVGDRDDVDGLAQPGGRRPGDHADGHGPEIAPGITPAAAGAAPSGNVTFFVDGASLGSFPLNPFLPTDIARISSRRCQGARIRSSPSTGATRRSSGAHRTRSSRRSPRPTAPASRRWPATASTPSRRSC